jgi:ribosomal-protein-alanine N-acetyltransferase
MSNVMVDAALKIRWMIRTDLFEVLQIEHENFDYPWDEAMFIEELRRLNSIGMVATVADCVTAYMLYEILPNRIHVTNFAVRKDCHRRGIGTRMVDKLKSKLSTGRRTSLFLEVRETNLAAQLFFKAMGFKCVATIPKHYAGTDEIAYQFQFRYQGE